MEGWVLFGYSVTYGVLSAYVIRLVVRIGTLRRQAEER